MGLCCFTMNNKIPGENKLTLVLPDTSSQLKNDSTNIKAAIKIQLTVRKFIAQKKLHELKKNMKSLSASEFFHSTLSENSKVPEIEAKYEPYVRGPTPEGLGKLERRPPTLLKDKVIYCGEWNIEKNVREGFGIQISPDGSK